MAKLVLLVVAAAWAAVLIPPMLRSRVDNRPNSSVTDFRRQLNKLQSTATPPRGSVRSMGRPLAQSSSPLMRQAAGGRPGQPARGGLATRQRPAAARGTDPTGDTPRYRSHGDPTGGQRRPQQPQQRRRDNTSPTQRARRPQQARRPEPMRAADPNAMVKRRRMNVLFFLVVTTACTMFLAATTASTAMQVVFALSFLSLCGYMYVLAQLREREDAAQTNGWLAQR